MAIDPQALGAMMAGGQQPQAPAPSGGGFAELLSNPAVAMALLQGGMGLASGQSGADAFGGALNTFLSMSDRAAQAKRQEAADKAAGQKAQMEAEQMAAEGARADRKLDIEEGKAADTAAYREGQLEIDREANRIAKLKIKAGEKAPAGFDNKAWSEALSTVEASAEVDPDTLEKTVDMGEVYKVYNTLVDPEQQKFMPFNSSTMNALVSRMEQTPDYAEQYLETAGQLYGDKAVMRLRKAFEKKRAAKKEEETEASTPLPSGFDAPAPLALPPMGLWERATTPGGTGVQSGLGIGDALALMQKM